MYNFTIYRLVQGVFLIWDRKCSVPPRETFLAAKSEEKRMFSQANKGVTLPYLTLRMG